VTVNFLLVAMLMLLWLMMNHHSLFVQPP